MTLWSRLKRLFTASDETAADVQLDAVQRLLKYNFVDRELLLLSLTHRSVARAANTHLPSNERLEFLGDSVLGLIIAAALYHDRPHDAEGDLTKQKAMLVNEVTLSMVAIEIGLNLHIRMSPEEERSGGRERPSIVSDAFEAVIGAMFLDGGFESSRRLVLDTIYSRKDVILSDAAQRNFKGELLELVQGRGEGMPNYEVVSEVGPDHDKTFHVLVSVNGTQLGEGKGSSKKEAEQRAASVALESFFHDH